MVSLMPDRACAMPSTTKLSRQALLRGGVGGGAALFGLAAFAGTAKAAGIPDGDLAYLRLLVGTELLKIDCATRMLASGKLAAIGRLVRQMQADDKAHYVGLAALLDGAGQQPASAGDIDFSYPRGSFASQEQM